MSANSNLTRRVLAAVACGTALLVASSTYAGPTRNQVRSVAHSEIGSATKILVRGTATPTFTVYKLERPSRVIVDVANATLAKGLVGDEGKATWQLNTWAVGQVAAHPMGGDRGAVVRVVVGLARAATYKVEAVGKDVVVIVSPRDAKPAVLDGVERERATQARAEADRARREAAQAKQRTAAAEAAAAAANRNASSARAQARAAAAETARLEQQLAAARAEARKAQHLIAEVKAEAEQARRDMATAKAAAERTVAAAEAEATRAKREAAALADRSSKRMAEAEAQRKAAERSLAQAQRIKKESEASVQAAKAAAEQAARREASAREAEQRATARKQEADRAARAATRYQKEADAARDGSGKALALRQRAEQAAREADQRRERAERAAREAEQRRAEAEKAATAAISRKEQAARITADAEARRASAEAQRSKALAQLTAVESELREAERRSKAAQADAEKAVELAGRAKALRAQEEAAYRRTVTAREQAETRRKKADRAAADLERSLQAEKTALAAAERQRAQAEAAQRAVADQERRAAGARAIAAAQAEARKHEAARTQAEAVLAARRAEVDRQRDKLARLQKERDNAASDLAELRQAAGKARAKREHEEKQLAELKERRAAAERELARTRKASAEARREAAAAHAQATAAEARAAEARAAAKKAAAAKATADQAAAELAKLRKAAGEARAKRKHEEQRLAELKQRRAAAKAAAAKAAAEAAAAEAAAAKAAADSRHRTARKARPKARVKDIDFQDAEGVARVVVAMSAPAKPRVVSEGRRKAVLEIPGATLSDELERTLDVTRFRGPIEAVSSYRDPDDPTTIRVEVQLAQPAASVLKKVGNTYRWEFAKPAVRTRRVARTAKRSTPAPPPAAGGYGGSSTPITQQTVAQVAGRRAKVYRGTKIDLDFKDADIHNLLRLLADVGGVNIVIPDEIKYRVTVRLRRVPWDQALEVILASKGLWYERTGNLYRIAPRKELDAQAQAEAERLQAMAQSEVPDTEYITLNYSNASDVAKSVSKMLSPKGDLQIDKRTNTVVVIDVKANRRKIVDLLRRLDTATPQIQIEARIVEARSSFSREFGVQWGGSASMSGATGNSTGLVFPNSVTAAGGNDTNQAPTGGLKSLPSDFAVNLPAATGLGSGGAIGLQLGSVGGNFGLNLRLSALEDQGTVRIISAPKITVINNTKAQISQGVSIPVSVVSANGAQTQFVPADLSLEVTPTVSQADCSITLDVNVKKNEADFVNTGSRGDPSILRKEAKTKILVADGATTVIGGIYTRNTGVSYSKVPFFADLPVIGWFFKNRKEADERTEVLVFITPKITNKAALRCESPATGIR